MAGITGAASWEDIEVGTRLPEFVRTTDLAHWNRYAAVNYEFIPIHMDPADAQAAGQPDVFGMGNLRLAYLHNQLHDWLGGSGAIVELGCQFRGFNFKHDRLEARATVAGKEVRDGAKLVNLEIDVVNQNGDNTTPGSATVQLFEGGKAGVLPDPGWEPVPEGREPGVYLDDAILSHLGAETEPSQSLPVDANDIRRWAIAVYWPERPPMEFYDEAIAEKGPWGGLVAPRDFNPFAWMLDLSDSRPWNRSIGTEPGHRILNGGRHTTYFAPIRPGDVITSTGRLADAYERDGRLGTMLFVVNDVRWTNQRGELVSIARSTGIYY